MSSISRDVYEPLPAPVPYLPPDERAPAGSRSDWAILAVMIVLNVVFASVYWQVDQSISLGILLGGLLIIGESWFTALNFLHRYPWMGLSGRWKIFVAAMAPWIVGLGAAWGLLAGLLAVIDRIR